MVSFKENGSLSDFQKANHELYGLADDRMYSLDGLLIQCQRFTMRALKGIRKEDVEKVKTNLTIAFSWFSAIANRLHIEVEQAVWRKFPNACSYCGKRPCDCKKIKPSKRAAVVGKEDERPHTLRELQEMFGRIYPPTTRTLEHAGIHLGEEMGEVSEAIHGYLGEHKSDQFHEIEEELADFVSCVMGVANSANVSMAEELSKMYTGVCHACGKAPCACSFTEVSEFKS